MTQEKLLYQGKAKKLYQTEEKNCLRVEYLDQATALNGARKDTIVGKAILNNEITAAIFDFLRAQGIDSHFIKKTSKTEQLVRAVTIVPLEVVVRNVAAGSFAKRLGVETGTPLAFPIVEFYYKNDALDDPFINDEQAVLLDLATAHELTVLKMKALEVNQVLVQLFDALGIDLIDFKVEFGRQADGSLLLADEITPDTCRLRDQQTGESLDKDVYRQQTGDLLLGYQEVLCRLQAYQKAIGKGAPTMQLVKIYVTYKDSVLDPQGEAVKGAIGRLGYQTIEEVRMGKYFEIKVADSEKNLAATIEAICDKLLANVTMETYRYEIVEAD